MPLPLHTPALRPCANLACTTVSLPLWILAVATARAAPLTLSLTRAAATAWQAVAMVPAPPWRQLPATEQRNRTHMMAASAASSRRCILTLIRVASTKP